MRGGLATFLTMAYILFANLSVLSGAGIPAESALAATALSAALCSALMGLVANVPLAMAPGMGLNAVVAFQIASATGSWQAAMGLVVVEGLLVLALVGAGVREGVLTAIPIDLRRAIGVGIGLFIAFIGAVNARLVVVPGSTVAALTADPNAALPPVTAGALAHPETLIALAGLLLVGILLARRQPGALLIGIVATTGLAALAAIVPAAATAPALIAVGFLMCTAITRIDDVIYGNCIHCGALLSEKRLNAVPWAPYCLDCQELEEKGMLQD